MTDLIFGAILIVAILCAIDLRLGMGLTLIAGFLQDPLRKIVDEAPVYYSGLVILFAAATFGGAILTGRMRTFRALPGWSARLKTPILLFVVFVFAQSIASLVYTGNIILAGIGLVVYLAPFPALLLAYSYASSAGRVHAFFWIYVAVSAAMLSGVYLTWVGLDWEILQSVGQPLVVYTGETGAPLDLPSGFLRSPEVAAWHAASGACVVLMLALSEGRKDTWLAGVALVLFFVGAVVLTGRRKFLLEIAVFLPILWFLLWRFRMVTARVLYLLFALALVSLAVVASGLVDSNTREAFLAPVVREGDRIDEIVERVMNLTVDAVPYIIATNGFFGSGAGTASGGAQYFGGGYELVGGAAEGGLGRILAEVGVPGILLFIWLGFRFAGQVWRTLALAAEGPPKEAQLVIGIAAFLLANAAVFVNAHQVYSDPFILLLVGSCLGFILATHRLRETRFVQGRLPARPGARFHPRTFHP